VAVVPGSGFRRAALGARVLFRESLSIGINIGEHMTVSATVEHLSNGSFFTEVNNGLTNVGVRLGYKF
jgi:hypothetical protein